MNVIPGRYGGYGVRPRGRLGLVDADGNRAELATHPRGLRWRQLPEVEAALGKGSTS